MEKISNSFGTYFYYPCKTENKKSTIIFIHGFATTSAYHDNFIKCIENEYDYIAIQLPGHGFEKWKLNHKPKVEDLENYCINLIKSLKLNQFIIMGHSMGAGLAIRVANFFNNQITCAILVTPMNSKISFLKIFNYFIFNPKKIKKMFHLFNFLYFDFAKTFHYDSDAINRFASEEFQYQNDNREFFVKLKKSMFSFTNLQNNRKAEIKISYPTLVIAGKNDSIIPLRSINKAFYKGKNKDKDFIRIDIISECAHLPFKEQENDYNKRIKEYVDVMVLKNQN